VPEICPVIFKPGPPRRRARSGSMSTWRFQRTSIIHITVQATSGARERHGFERAHPVPDDVPGGFDACLLVHMTPSWGPKWGL